MEQTDRKIADLPWPQSIKDFEALVDLMQHRLVHFAFCRLRSREDAEDVVQEVLVQAYRDRQKYRAVANAGPFLFRMVANRCTDLLRRRRHEGGPLKDIASELGTSGDDLAETARRLRRVEESLQRLPSRQAEAVRLRVYGDLPFHEVAEAMGCSVPTVKSRFRYAIQKLRSVLQREGGVR